GRGRPVARSVTDTGAPGMAAPDGARTTPVRAPEATWPKAAPADSRTKTTAAVRSLGRSIPVSLASARIDNQFVQSRIESIRNGGPCPRPVYSMAMVGRLIAVAVAVAMTGAPVVTLACQGVCA